MRISKWGTGLAVRLPASVVQALDLHEGDEIELFADDPTRFSISRKPDRAEVIKRLRSFRGRLPIDFKLDRDDSNAR